MHPGLARLISDYQSAVKRAVELMQASGIPLPPSNTEWVAMQIPQTGTLENGAAYFKHGYGCAVKVDDRWVDFDFGGNGEIDWFDVGRLEHFAGSRLAQYGLPNKEALEKVFGTEVSKGTLVHSEYILYYLASSGPTSRRPVDNA